MTRINVVPVDELTDNFILAEYYELPRIFPLVHLHIQKNRTSQMLRQDGTIPPCYRFGRGHMGFFYDKLQWLYQRHLNLGIAGSARGLKLQIDPMALPYDPWRFIDTEWWNDYQPTPEAIQLNWDRLQYRRRYDGGEYQGSLAQ